MEDFAMVRRGSFGAATVTAAVVTVLALALAGCAPGVQPLLDDYNALFGSVTERGQEGAQEDGDWLQDQYRMSIGGSPNTLNLHAPENCEPYTWWVEVVPESTGGQEQAGPDIEAINEAIKDSGSYLALEMNQSGFQAGRWYKLTSTIVRDGETLSDSCYIIIETE